MRRGPIALVLVLAAVLGAQTPAGAQATFSPPPVPPRATMPSPLGFYAMGGIACAAVSPMIGTLMLNRELTIPEVDRMTLSCFLGPVGWLLGPVLFPDVVITAIPPKPPENPPPRGPRQARGRHIDIPPRGVTAFVRNEILLEVESGTPAQYLNVVARRLQLTLLETHSFTLTGRTLAALAH